MFAQHIVSKTETLPTSTLCRVNLVEVARAELDGFVLDDGN